MSYNTNLSRDVLDRAISEITSEWRIRTAAASPSEAGHHAVYRLTIDTPEGVRECYLKATPEEKSPSVDLEARILAVLGSRTALPVPTVYGAIDAHDELPTPCVLLEAMPGEATTRTGVASLSEGRYRRIARETGRYLADLHAVDAVDAFGFLNYQGSTLRGERPGGGLDALTVADPISDWHERLRDWARGTIDGLHGTRFADLAPAAERAVGARIGGLEGGFTPSLARIDQSLENVLLTDGRLSAMIDWEFTISATPAYDVVHCVQSLAGGPYLFAPGVPDRRTRVLEAVLEGYREEGPGRVIDQVYANRDCYELLFALRAMANLEDWYRMLDLDGRIDEAAAELRREVTAHR